MLLFYLSKLPWTSRALILSEFVRFIVLSQFSMIWEEIWGNNCANLEDYQLMKAIIIVLAISYQPLSKIKHCSYELGLVIFQTITYCKIAMILSQIKCFDYANNMTNSKLKTFTKLLLKLDFKLYLGLTSYFGLNKKISCAFLICIMQNLSENVWGRSFKNALKSKMGFYTSLRMFPGVQNKFNF